MNLGMPEMLFLFVLALLIFGPRKLPEIGRNIGKGLAEFKRASNEFKSQIETEVRDLELREERDKQGIGQPPAAAPPGTVAVGIDDSSATPGTVAIGIDDSSATPAPKDPNPAGPTHA